MLIIKRDIWGLISLGVLQIIGSEHLDYVIKLLVPRASGISLANSNRGVTLLASEPARAGVELTLIYLMMRLTQERSMRTMLTDIFLIFFQAMVIKSASAVAFTICAFALVYLRINFKFSSLVKTVILSVVIVIFLIDVLPSLGGRAGDLARYIINIDNVGDIIFYVANESGNRILALYSFLVAGFNHPFGFGVGSWPYSSMTAVLESGIDYRDFRFFHVHAAGDLKAFRGPGVISNLLLDVGIIGTLSIAILFVSALNRYGKFTSTTFIALWIFLVKIFFFGSPGNPIVFIFFICVFLALSPKELRLKN
ncbi:hypothetical protein JCM19238_3255 [Vibrio ponticus]|nr:hypothetical protein JCM19238_3255 [Vibrio ponticus]